MKGSPAKLGTIQGTSSHSSALKMAAETEAAQNSPTPFVGALVGGLAKKAAGSLIKKGASALGKKLGLGGKEEGGDSPAKQGYRPTYDKKGNKIDYTDPEVLRKEKEGNQRIHDIIAGKYDKDKKRKKKEPTRPPKKKSPAKQGLILDKRTKEQKAKDQKSKELWDKTVNIDDVPGVGGEKSKMQKQMEGRKTDMKKEKSPGKWVQFIPMALSALSSMKKK